ncbi:MerR family transcriptional regulator [Desemzia sp. C1]|uniref:MerR family transcriptional regulator n=1 Tax=Desemzia sp. C1 TaxID=2892016 RepID=UPI001E540FF7|nr:MerR family transcriptional regulator [Desemzia sp. C1]MCI3028189.1 MerR family transcriptional regulator [Desemzia sp. C1]
MNIKSAAKMFELSIDTLRYYERVGVIPPVKRDKNGYRNYTTMDLNWIFLAKSLRKAGLSIESMIEFATLAQSTEDVSKAQKEILSNQLQQIEARIVEMEQARDLLIHKIATYDEHVAQFQAGSVEEKDIEQLWEMAHVKEME